MPVESFDARAAAAAAVEKAKKRKAARRAAAAAGGGADAVSAARSEEAGPASGTVLGDIARIAQEHTPGPGPGGVIRTPFTEAMAAAVPDRAQEPTGPAAGEVREAYLAPASVDGVIQSGQVIDTTAHPAEAERKFRRGQQFFTENSQLSVKVEILDDAPRPDGLWNVHVMVDEKNHANNSDGFRELSEETIAGLQRGESVPGFTSVAEYKAQSESKNISFVPRGRGETAGAAPEISSAAAAAAVKKVPAAAPAVEHAPKRELTEANVREMLERRLVSQVKEDWKRGFCAAMAEEKNVDGARAFSDEDIETVAEIYAKAEVPKLLKEIVDKEIERLRNAGRLGSKVPVGGPVVSQTEVSPERPAEPEPAASGFVAETFSVAPGPEGRTVSGGAEPFPAAPALPAADMLSPVTDGAPVQAPFEPMPFSVPSGPDRATDDSGPGILSPDIAFPSASHDEAGVLDESPASELPASADGVAEMATGPEGVGGMPTGEDAPVLEVSGNAAERLGQLENFSNEQRAKIEQALNDGNCFQALLLVGQWEERWFDLVGDESEIRGDEALNGRISNLSAGKSQLRQRVVDMVLDLDWTNGKNTLDLDMYSYQRFTYIAGKIKEQNLDYTAASRLIEAYQKILGHDMSLLNEVLDGLALSQPGSVLEGVGRFGKGSVVVQAVSEENAAYREVAYYANGVGSGSPVTGYMSVASLARINRSSREPRLLQEAPSLASEWGDSLPQKQTFEMARSVKESAAAIASALERGDIQVAVNSAVDQLENLRSFEIKHSDLSVAASEPASYAFEEYCQARQALGAVFKRLPSLLYQRKVPASADTLRNIEYGINCTMRLKTKNYEEFRQDTFGVGNENTFEDIFYSLQNSLMAIEDIARSSGDIELQKLYEQSKENIDRAVHEHNETVVGTPGYSAEVFMTADSNAQKMQLQVLEEVAGSPGLRKVRLVDGSVKPPHVIEGFVDILVLVDSCMKGQPFAGFYARLDAQEPQGDEQKPGFIKQIEGYYVGTAEQALKQRNCFEAFKQLQTWGMLSERHIKDGTVPENSPYHNSLNLLEVERRRMEAEALAILYGIEEYTEEQLEQLVNYRQWLVSQKLKNSEDAALWSMIERYGTEIPFEDLPTHSKQISEGKLRQYEHTLKRCADLEKKAKYMLPDYEWNFKSNAGNICTLVVGRPDSRNPYYRHITLTNRTGPEKQVSGVMSLDEIAHIREHGYDVSESLLTDPPEGNVLTFKVFEEWNDNTSFVDSRLSEILKGKISVADAYAVVRDYDRLRQFEARYSDMAVVAALPHGKREEAVSYIERSEKIKLQYEMAKQASLEIATVKDAEFLGGLVSDRIEAQTAAILANDREAERRYSETEKDFTVATVRQALEKLPKRGLSKIQKDVRNALERQIKELERDEAEYNKQKAIAPGRTYEVTYGGNINVGTGEITVLSTVPGRDDFRTVSFKDSVGAVTEGELSCETLEQIQQGNSKYVRFEDPALIKPKKKGFFGGMFT